MVNRLVDEVEKDQSMKGLIKSIDLLQAMHCVDLSWKSVPTDCVINCWYHSGYSNFSNQNYVNSSFENTLQCSLNMLSNLSINFCTASELMSQVTFEYENYFD